MRIAAALSLVYADQAASIGWDQVGGDLPPGLSFPAEFGCPFCRKLTPRNLLGILNWIVDLELDEKVDVLLSLQSKWQHEVSKCRSCRRTGVGLVSVGSSPLI